MRVARTIASLATTTALVLALLAQAVPAGAVEGYNSKYFGESAFVFLSPGQSNQFAVGFTNTGAVGWLKGTASQVNLAQCCPINTPSPNSSWAVNWLSSTAYATTTTDYVGPGQIGWYVYTVKAPSNATAGNYSFNGDLVLAATGEAINREGYFQIATVPTAPAPGAGVPAPGAAIPTAVSSVSCLGLREIKVQFNQAMSTDGTTSIGDPAHFALSGGLDIDGSRPSADKTSAILTVGRGSVSFHDLSHLSNEPDTIMANNGSYTLTVKDVATSGFSMTGTSTTTFTCTDSTGPTVSAPTQPGTFTMVLTFSEPMDLTSTNASIKWDSTLFTSIGNLHWQDRTANDCASGAGCFQKLRLDFDKAKLSSIMPSAGSHTLEIRDAKDAAGNLISPNPTTFTVTIVSETTAPTISTVAISISGNTFRLDITYSESMAHAANGFATTTTTTVGTSGAFCTASGTGESIDCGGNYLLRNPDGSTATTGGASGSGTTITLANVQPGTDAQLSTSVTARYELRRIRLQLAPAGESPALRPNTTYSVEVQNVKDQAGNSIAAGTVKTFTWPGDSTALAATRAFATSTQLFVDYSELVNNSGSSVRTPSNYASPNSQFQNSLKNMTFTTLSDDATGVVFTYTTALPTGTYELDISNVKDPFGNLISPNPTIINVTVSDTTKPSLTAAAETDAATPSKTMTVTYSEQVKGGTTDANSAGNSSNYSIDGGAFGSLCSVGSPTITAGVVAGTQTWTITCSGTGATGAWSAGGTHTVTVKDVQDLSGNTIDPNPSTKSFTTTP